MRPKRRHVRGLLALPRLAGCSDQGGNRLYRRSSGSFGDPPVRWSHYPIRMEKPGPPPVLHADPAQYDGCLSLSLTAYDPIRSRWLTRLAVPLPSRRVRNRGPVEAANHTEVVVGVRTDKEAP